MEHWRRYRQPQIYQQQPSSTTRRPILKRFKFRLSVRFWLIISAAAVGLTGLWLVGFSSVFMIRNIRIEGEATLAAQSALSQLTGRRIFTVTESFLMEELKRVDPSLASLRIAKGLPDQINVYLERRHPSLVWQTAAGRWGIDREGYAFPLDETTAQGVPMMLDQRNLPVPTGERLLLPELIEFILDGFKELPTRVGGQITRAEIGETTYHVRFVTEWGWTIILAVDRPINGQLTNLDLIIKSQRDQIHEYLDLRLAGWAYIK